MKKIIWDNCNLITMKEGKLNIIENAVIITENEFIIWLGIKTNFEFDFKFFNSESLEKDFEIINLNNAWITPGFIDCHTHIIFGGNRSNEFEQRLNGINYIDIAKNGGGIINTVNQTRLFNEDNLYNSAIKRLNHLMNDGVTTIEIKSGYGLNLESERKMLKVARKLNQDLKITIKNTCLAAHTIPPEYLNKSDDYVDYVCEIILPTLNEENLIDAVDVFCEKIAFNLNQTRKIFEKAKKLNLDIKIHAEQLSNMGGASLATEFKALSADHIEYLNEEDVQNMSKAGTVAVLLPGAFFMLNETQKPPIKILRKYGVKMAISTDLNPGTSPTLSLRLMLNFACILFKLTVEEAIAGVTINAAKALGIENKVGSLEVGKIADFIIWNIERPADLVYWLGGNLEHKTVYHGTFRN